MNQNYAEGDVIFYRDYDIGYVDKVNLIGSIVKIFDKDHVRVVRLDKHLKIPANYEITSLNVKSIDMNATRMLNLLVKL